MKSLLQNKHTKKTKQPVIKELHRVTQNIKRIGSSDWSWRAVIFGKTPAHLDRFQTRFECTPTQPHSQLMAITIKVLKEEKQN